MKAYAPRNAQDRTWQVIDAVRDIAAARGVSMARVALAWVALAWVADRPSVTSVILGARTVEQLDDNLGAAGLHLTAAETTRLTEVSAPVVADYPYGELGVRQRDRVVQNSKK